MRPRRISLDPRRLFTIDFLIGALIFVFALALRWWGVRGSLPYVGHPDEPKLVDSAVHMIKSGDLNPHLYIWPSLYIYLEALVIRANVLVGTLRGAYTGPQSLPDVSHIFALASGVYVWARTLTAFAGATTATLLYVVGKEMFNNSRKVGVAASLMLAASPLHIEYSHYALTDVPLALIGLLVLWASYRLSRTSPGPPPERFSRDPFLWQAILCGLLVGLATGTKYNGLYLGIVPLLAWVLASRRGRERWGGAPATNNRKNRTTVTPVSPRLRLIFALTAIPVAALVGFLLAEPYAILDWPSFYNGFTFQVEAYVPARNLDEVFNSIATHITALSASDMYFFLPASLGAITLLLNPPARNRAWLLVPFPILYTLAMSRFSLVYVRNLLVTLPFLAILAGYVVDLVAMQVTTLVRGYVPVLRSESVAGDRRFWNSVRWALLALALAFVIGEPLRVASNYSQYMAAPESRNTAWEWMQERMRAGDRFAAELHPWQTQDRPDVLAFDVENPGDPHPLTVHPPAWYAAHGYRYLVLSSNFKDSKRDSSIWPLYRDLPVVKVFDGDKEGGKGPTITVLDAGQVAEGGLPQRTKQSGARLEDIATLAGYDLAPVTSPDVLLDPAEPGTANGSTPEFKRGEAIGLNMYFRALKDGQPGDPDWQVWIHLVNAADNSTVSQISVAPLVGQLKDYPRVVQQPHPVSEWQAGEMLAGVYNLPIPESAPPGTYRVEAGMWVPPNGPGARVYPGTGGSGSAQPTDRVTLGEITIK